MKPCPSRIRELLNLVDGALAAADRDKLHVHLVSCIGCRDELASLRAVRERIRTADTPASDALTSRLIQIAGSEAAEPLYARPFDRSAGGVLPSRRRTRQAVAGAFTITCFLLAGLVGVGWAAAPPTRTPALDPGPMAREEFAAILDDLPLADPAVVLTRTSDTGATKAESLIGTPAPTTGLHPEGARAALERAARAQASTAYAGVAVVQIRHLAGYWVSRVEVEARPGRGAEVRPLGARSDSGATVVGAGDTAELTRLGAAYQLLTGPGPVIAGYPSILVEARTADRVVARWWLDRDSGLVLWRQTFDRDGRPLISAGFDRLRIGAVTRPRHLAPKLTPERGITALALTSAPTLEQQGWQCRDRLAGLELTGVRGHRSAAVVQTVYSDGITTLSVLEQKGALTGAPDGFVWDPQVRAYRSLGVTTMYAWQSGDAVFTVTTDGPAVVAEQAVAELPHASPVLRTRVDRVLDGWRALVGVSR